MEKLVPTFFQEIYRKCFGMTYDAAQESTWQWLTTQHISNFYVPVYTRDDPPSPCLTLRKGHRPKMFLWMVEEFAFVLWHLHKDDNRSLVLDHDLLLLACSWCCQKRGGAWGSCCAGPTPLDRLATCTFKTLEHAVLVTDTIQLEHLTWVVVDNIMGPGETPPISGLETYNQIIGRLAGKVVQGIAYALPSVYICLFCTEVTRVRVEGPDSKRRAKPQCYSMMRDVREEFMGSYSALK